MVFTYFILNKDRKKVCMLKITLIILSISLVNFMYGQDDHVILKQKLEKAFPGIVIKEKKCPLDYLFSWELHIPQYLNHKQKSQGGFRQLIYLYHKGFKNPNVMVTEGYNIADRIYEPSIILNANQFSVEYRFCGKSTPQSIPWSLLNHEQAMKDLCYIQKRLSKIYKESWTVTGVSKGGTTAALYALTYPKKVKATVAYVAPFVLAQEDYRTIEHYTKKVSTSECRQQVLNFQRAILQNREALISMIDSLAIRDNVKFPIGSQRVLEYASMEFPFTFWQWGYKCSDLISVHSSPKEIFNYVEKVVDFNYYDDKTVKQFEPAFYQFMTEFGYYDFDTTGLSDLLIYEKNPTNLTFCPKGVDINYNPAYLLKMTDKAIHNGKNIIYIYGEVDTWTACAVTPSSKTNCKKYVAPEQGHRVRIRNLSNDQKREIYQSLEKWTGSKTKKPD